MYNVQQDDIDLLFQKLKEYYIKFELLNKDFKTIDEIKGVISSGSYSTDANSDIRRTLSAEIFLKDKSLLVGKDKKIWLDKYVRVYIGVKSVRTNQIKYYSLGMYLFSDNSFTYDADTKTVSVTCLDLMCKFTGERNGQLPSLLTQIPVGSNIRDVLVSLVSDLGKTKKYLIEDIKKTIPYDLKFSVGATIFEIIREIRDLYPSWETFFDEDTFVFKQIPNGASSNIVLDSQTLKRLIISENINNTFAEIKNKTVIWGKSIKTNYVASFCSNANAMYSLNVNQFSQKDGKTILFVPNVNNQTNTTIKVNTLAAFPLLETNNTPVIANKLKAGSSYVIKYAGNKFYFIGRAQLYAESEDNNPNSPYYVGDNHENVILQVLTGKDYEKIPDEALCKERADYENWKSTRLTDNLVLQLAAIPWLDVNCKIEYQSYITGEINQYIIKKIDFDLTTGIQTVTAIKFYPLYPEIVRKR